MTVQSVGGVQNAIFALGFAAIFSTSAPAFGADISPHRQCREIPGLPALLDRKDLRYLIIGDVHGTKEIPEFVGDIICSAAATHREVSVGLEWPRRAAGATDQFMNSSGDAQARASLIEGFPYKLDDGRGSVAMFALIERLRALRAAGAKLNVFAFQPDGGSDFEKRMAEQIIEATKEASPDLTVVYVGNFHASKHAASEGPGYAPMASFLPADGRISINTAVYFGTAWNCQRPEEEDQSICKIWPMSGDTPPSPLGITLNAGLDDRFDGYYSVGKAYTASPPATP